MTARDIGVAIGVPEPFARELQSWRERLGDPNAGRIPPHITLLTPTVLQPADLVRAERHLQRIALGQLPFRIHLRGSGTFRPTSPVVFVTLVKGIAQCERLQDQVRTGPLERPLRFPYHPHVTVAHDLDDAALDKAFDELADYEAEFDVWAFTLFERGRDGAWRPQRDFPLGCGQIGPQMRGHVNGQAG